MRKRIFLNEGWIFSRNYTEEMKGENYEAGDSLPVRLPHTVTETPFNCFDESVYQMVSGYRRQIFVPGEWEGKRLLLTFEGVAHDCEVYCNGVSVGAHHCGYTAFTINIGGAVRYGEDNVIAVKVDSREELNIPPFGYVVDYMTYGGIYRDMYLEVLEQCSLEDVFHYCEIEDEAIYEGGKKAAVTLCSEYRIHGERRRKNGLTLRQYLARKGRPETEKCILEAGPDDEEELSGFRTRLKNIKLWSPEHPVLYTLRTCLYDGEELMDEVETDFGFRKAVFQAQGFFLNGRKYKIRGLNRHQSYPYVGYAMPRSMQELDADILKNELGVNAVRTSHYPQSHYFLSRCDEIGLLVFTEIPGWQHIGDAAWKKQAVQNTEDMVLQYRNHTSIVLWGVRINESRDEDGFYRKTNEVAHRLDPSRQTGGVRAHKKSSFLEDVYTYNDFVHDGRNKGCEPKRNVTSDRSRGYLVSEYNGHMYPTKAYDPEEHMREHALRHANVLDAVAGEPDIAGSFGWCMFDYNTHKDFGSGDRICYHGVLDMFRNAKPAAQIYACQQEKDIVLALSSSMDIGEHPGSNRGATWIYSNADSVKMYKNGRFIKEYYPEDSPWQNLKHGPVMLDDFIGDAILESGRFQPEQAEEIKRILNDAAVYGLGKLPKEAYLSALKLMLVYRMKPNEAVALYQQYIGDWGGASTVYRFEAVKNGKTVKCMVKEPVREIRLQCDADHCRLEEINSYDVALVRIRAVDQNGNIVPFFNEPVELSAKGNIEIIGPACISLKGGMGGTYVRSLGKEGTGSLKLKNPQSEEVEIRFTIHCPERSVETVKNMKKGKGGKTCRKGRR